MKRILLALAAVIAISGPALADQALAKAKKCLSCHAVEKAKVGPSFKDIAKQNDGKPDAAAKLAAVIASGKGAMPPSPQVNEAEAKKLVAWILSLK